MFKVFARQFRYSLSSARVYVALLIGVVSQIICIMPLLDFSKSVNQPLCIFEGFIYFNCDLYAAFAASLGVILLMSDIPFSTQNETYTLLRISRRKWLLGKLLYLLCASVLYYVVVFVFGAVFILENAYCGDSWSQLMQMLAKGGGASYAAGYNVYFPYGNILLSLSPAKAAVISLALNVCYSCLMSLVIFWLNLKFHRTLSYFAAIMFHVANYVFIAVLPMKALLRVSLFGNSLLMFHQFDGSARAEQYFTLPQSFLLFGVTALFLYILLLRAIKRYDFRITVGTRR